MRILLELGGWPHASRVAQAELLQALADALHAWDRALLEEHAIPSAMRVTYYDPGGPMGTPDRWRDAWTVAADGVGDCVELAAIWAARRPDRRVEVLPPPPGSDAWHAVGRSPTEHYEPHTGVI